MKTMRLSALSCAILAAALPGYPQETSPAQPGQKSAETRQSQPSADKSPVQAKNGIPARINKARALIGMQIRNPQDERLGKVKDMVLDLQSGCISYVVLSTGGLRPKFLALPPSALRASADGKHLVLNADWHNVMGAAGFKRDAWPNMATPSWGAEPFWQTPDGKSYDNGGYDKNLEFDKNPTTQKNKDQEPTPTSPDR